MACFTVPATEAIITTVAQKIIKSKEKNQTVKMSHEEAASDKISFSTKLGWLNKMLWGGSALLAFEHVWHGEVVPFFPFLTAVKDGNAGEMLHEMATTGVTMALIVSAVWGLMVLVSNAIEKRKDNPQTNNVKGVGLA